MVRSRVDGVFDIAVGASGKKPTPLAAPKTQKNVNCNECEVYLSVQVDDRGIILQT